MKKITEQDLEKLKLKTGRSSPIRIELLALQPAEILQIDRKDCPGKNGPYYIMRRIMDRSEKKFSYKKIADNSGWVIQRIK